MKLFIREMRSGENRVEVTNRHGHKYKKSENESWLSYWKEKQGINKNETVDCANIACNNDAEVGGHIHLKEDYDKPNKFYIVPLCSKCNSCYNEDSFEVFEDDLIEAVEKTKKM